MTDIVERLRTVDISWSQEGEWCAEAADEIVKLREALLDAVGFVSRADNLFLKQATTDTLKGIPDGYR